MNLDTVTNHAVLADLYIVSNLLSTNNAILVNVDIVSDDHLGVPEATLLLHVARSDHALLPDNGINAHRDLCEVTTEDGARLNNCLAVDQNFL